MFKARQRVRSGVKIRDHDEIRGVNLQGRLTELVISWLGTVV